MKFYIKNVNMYQNDIQICLRTLLIRNNNIKIGKNSSNKSNNNCKNRNN
jgi:hypothetical protein